jgi:phosphate transport system protein
MTGNRHINAEFDVELASLKEQISRMGRLVAEHVTEALSALIEGDSERARAVILADRLVNRMEIAIDEQCVRMLVLRQPAASDLRFIAAALKIVTDLERIGDLSANMAERALTLIEEPKLRAAEDLPELCSRAQEMLRLVLEAFVTSDVAKAEAVIAADREVDRRTANLIEEVQADMSREPGAVRRGVAMIFFAKHIERMADHSTNVAERVIYHVCGREVRHGESGAAGEGTAVA